MSPFLFGISMNLSFFLIHFRFFLAHWQFFPAKSLSRHKALKIRPQAAVPYNLVLVFPPESLFFEKPILSKDCFHTDILSCTLLLQTSVPFSIPSTFSSCLFSGTLSAVSSQSVYISLFLSYDILLYSQLQRLSILFFLHIQNELTHKNKRDMIRVKELFFGKNRRIFACGMNTSQKH